VCFVVTEVGISSLGGPAPSHPTWDRRSRELRLGELVVKQYKMPAAVQIAILDAFEEEDWPPRIDDPLPPRRGLDPQDRLREAIKSLNRNQDIRILRFQGDGTRCGVRWRLLALGRPQLTPTLPLCRQRSRARVAK
jgi:hypothetical protein